MNDANFSAFVDGLVCKATDRLNAAWSDGRGSTKKKLERWAAVANLLVDVRLKSKRGRVLLMQSDIAARLPTLGHHSRHDSVPAKDAKKTTLRTVRQIVEGLRDIYKYPILSTPGKKKDTVKVNAGYWIARNYSEVTAWLDRTGPEIQAVTLSCIATRDSIRCMFEMEPDSFSEVRSALERMVFVPSSSVQRPKGPADSQK